MVVAAAGAINDRAYEAASIRSLLALEAQRRPDEAVGLSMPRRRPMPLKNPEQKSRRQAE